MPQTSWKALLHHIIFVLTKSKVMETLLQVMLVIHIISGFLSLLSGLVALVAKKGRRAHRLAGKVFFYGMLGVSASALIIAIPKGNGFLAMIGIFAFFQNYSGYHSIKNKSLKPSITDWLVLAIAAVNSVFMIYSFNIVLMVFGGISISLVINDLRIFIITSRGRELKKMQWILRHIGMMIGAYIATVTAFVVVNVKNFQPFWLPWLLPTVILVPLIIYYTAKYSRKAKKSVAALLLLFCFSLALRAQPYTTAKTRHRFAQLNLGADTRTWFGNAHSFRMDAGGNKEPFTLGNHTETRLTIGGTHFWGHADFYIAFPVASFGNSGMYTGPETGAKFYPWQITNKGVRPYIGAAWLPVAYTQGEGVHQLRHKFPLLAGFTYNRGNHLVELNVGYNYSNNTTYYINRNNSVPVQTQPLWAGITYKYMFETTLSAEKHWQSGRTKRLTDTLAKLKRLNGFTIAAGISAGFFLKTSPHNEVLAPYLDDHKVSNIFPDLGIGYYLHKPDVQFNIAYRNIKSSIAAYGHAQVVRRNSVAMEAYKFFADYHGFAPFAGAALSYEQVKITETASATLQDKSIKPGIVAGWDIRPDRLQGWYLRTNLRWFPALDVNMASGNTMSLDMLEVNFIQLVVFPGRIW